MIRVGAPLEGEKNKKKTKKKRRKLEAFSCWKKSRGNQGIPVPSLKIFAEYFRNREDLTLGVVSSLLADWEINYIDLNVIEIKLA